MPAAQLNEQRVDGSYLYAATAAGVPDFGGFDVIFPIRLKECQRRQALNKLRSGLRARESLQKLLQHQPGGEDLIGSQEGLE